MLYTANKPTISGPNDDLIIAYLDTQFTKRIHSDFSDDYKFTAAIAQELTTNFIENDQEDIHRDGYVAIKYPSVLGGETFYNTAMHASFANERLELLHVMELRILAASGNNVSVEPLDNAIDFTDGQIEWTGDPSLIPTLLDETRSIPFVYNGSKWKLRLYDGDVTADYVERLMLD